MILGVMLSVLFGFYVTQLTSLIGSSASRFLYERISEKLMRVYCPCLLRIIEVALELVC